MTFSLCYLMRLMQCSKLLVTSITQPCSYRFLRGASSTYKEIKFTDTLTQRTSFILALPAVFMGIDWTPTDLCNHANTTGNDGSFSLSATHAPQAGGYKDTPPQVVRAQVPPAGIQQSQLHRKEEIQNITYGFKQRFITFLTFVLPLQIVSFKSCYC